MKNLLYIFPVLFLFFISCKQKEQTHTEVAIPSPVDFVDMFMGVQKYSNCVIGPQLPHGSVNPSPQTPNGHHDGYHPDEPIRGFGQLHASGTGWGRYGQIFISPQTRFNAEEDGHDSPKSGEQATPYYYAVTLDRYNIKAEVTPTHHCAFYRFAFPESDSANILLDIAHNIPQHIVPFVNGKFEGGEIKYNRSNGILSGWGEYIGGFGNDTDPYKVYYAVSMNVEPREVLITDHGKDALFAQIVLPQNPDTVLLRVGISMKSVENAHRFLEKELAQHLTFEEIKAQAFRKWEDVFARISVEGGSEEEKSLFYTAMYHSFVMPRERTGDNPFWESDRPHLDDHYCVWDTWRTKYPLMVLINESFVAKTINSFMDRFAHQGVVKPTYTSSLVWDWKQGGDDVENIIADAFIKNVKGFDRQKAYEFLKWSAFNERDEKYLQLGWVPEPAERMSCSYTMEYAYNDFCSAQVALMMGDETMADTLRKRASQWVNLFNPEMESHGFKGFVIPRKENRQWISIDPAQRYGSWVEYFYEGNSWVYTLFTPHQFEKLVNLCGGKEEMVKRLSYGFENELIELDNEPGFLSPFIFHYCDRPDLTATYVRKIREEHFSLTTGYPENEDSGAMGAWYIFTSIGFFPNAGQDLYYLLPPAFDEVIVTMENGNKIHIKTEKQSEQADAIESVRLNGQVLDRMWITHSEIAQGAELVYVLK
ncbi:MAG: GH92 family glycosyl hydrolase [Candidatus Azobacteroides sp.]|nr:GH92 family glycosyl hydrolase [Candidatus Azobacteroides sp.]